MAIKLIILGLRRSGTTVFWQTFRLDGRLRCYDEPFCPLLQFLAGPGVRDLKHPEEYLDLLRKDSAEFQSRFVPIDLWDELREGLSDKHVEYLRYLAGTADRVVIDVTRCHFKIASLHECAPDAVLVHLYRPPPANVTSHMLPTASSKYKTMLRRLLNRPDFWTRCNRFNYWHFETIMGTSQKSLFAQRLKEIGLDPEQIYGLPAVAKLLAYWRVHYERAEQDGARYYGKRFIPQNLDEFCCDPRSVTEAVYQAMDMEMPQRHFGHIHPAKPAYRPNSPKWQKYAELLNLPEV